MRGYRFLFLGTCPGETRTQSLGLERSWAGSDQPLPTTGLSARSLVLILCIYGSLQQSRNGAVTTCPCTQSCTVVYKKLLSLVLCQLSKNTCTFSRIEMTEILLQPANIIFLSHQISTSHAPAPVSQQFFSLTRNQHQPPATAS